MCPVRRDNQHLVHCPRGASRRQCCHRRECTPQASPRSRSGRAQRDSRRKRAHRRAHTCTSFSSFSRSKYSIDTFSACTSSSSCITRRTIFCRVPPPPHTQAHTHTFTHTPPPTRTRTANLAQLLLLCLRRGRCTQELANFLVGRQQRTGRAPCKALSPTPPRATFQSPHRLCHQTQRGHQVAGTAA